METAQALFNSINDPEALRRMGLHLLDEISTLNKALNEARREQDAKSLPGKSGWISR